MNLGTLIIISFFISLDAFGDCSAYGPPSCVASCASSCTYVACLDSGQSPTVTINTIPAQWQAMTSNCDGAAGTLNMLSQVDQSVGAKVYADGSFINQVVLPATVHLAHTGDASDLSAAPKFYCASQTNVNNNPCPLDGVCGSDNGAAVTGGPTNLCATGGPSGVSGSGPWSWSCGGQYGGADANCSAVSACTPGDVVLASASFSGSKSITSWTAASGLNCHLQNGADSNDTLECSGNIPNVDNWHWGCNDGKVYGMRINNSWYPGDYSGSGHNGDCPGGGFQNAGIGVSGGAVTELQIGARSGSTFTIYGHTSCP